MMYVKHVVIDGHERIYEAIKVANVLKKASRQRNPQKKEPLANDFGFFFTAPDLSIRKLTGGVVFVMNEVGRTIQAYDLRKD